MTDEDDDPIINGDDDPDKWCNECATYDYCEQCEECHNCHAQKTDKPKRKKEVAVSSSLVPTTQKAKGVIGLMKAGYTVPYLMAIVKETGKSFSYPAFARPCPVRPRHGVVDSRVVNSDDQLDRVIIETLAADPDGEVMLMSPINAEWSALWTPTSITFGPGNDGATAGKDTVTLPLCRGEGGLTDRLYDPLTDYGIGEDEDPYVELVRGGSYLYWTQLRAGPRLGAVTKNFIPARVEVKEILTTSHKDDVEYTLLEWEKLISEKHETDGLVVYHPGGSMTDHFTVHARTYGIPVILSSTPGVSVGDVLEKETDTPPLSPQSILMGIATGEAMELPEADTSNLHPYVALLLTGLYNSSQMGGDYGRWLGISTALMLRLGSAALSGEARHIDRQSGKKMKLREEIYNRTIPFTLARHRARVNRLTNILRYGFDAGSIGGEKWARCGAALMPLFNAVGLLAREPSEESAGALIRALNLAVDQAHNNGWWLNKFTPEGDLYTKIQNGTIAHIAASGPAAMKAEETYQSLSTTRAERRIASWAGWSPLSFKPMKVREADIITLPGWPGLSFRVRSRLLGKKEKEINISADKLKDAMSTLMGSFYITEGEHGLAVELRRGKDRTTIWTEGTLS
jgi:hypothetical protein